MPSRVQLMNHERHRWSYMDERRLNRRLAKITNGMKLECFLEMAIAQGNRFLATRCRERMEALGFTPPWHLRDATQVVQEPVRLQPISTVPAFVGEMPGRSETRIRGVEHQDVQFSAEQARQASEVMERMKSTKEPEPVKKKAEIRTIRFRKSEGPVQQKLTFED